MNKVLDALNAITGAVLGTSLGMIIFIPAAFAERGYWGMGGEWILIALCGAIGWHVVEKKGENNGKVFQNYAD